MKIDGRPDEQPLLILRWEENGGPATALPADRGFGLTLLERLTRRNEQAEPVFEWRAAGLYCCFSLRMSRSAASGSSFGVRRLALEIGADLPEQRTELLARALAKAAFGDVVGEGGPPAVSLIRRLTPGQ